MFAAILQWRCFDRCPRANAMNAWISLACVAIFSASVHAVEGQPLAANAERLQQAMQFLGAPLPDETAKALTEACRLRDADAIQQVVDPHVSFIVSINPESRVKTERGRAAIELQQGGYVPVIVKVNNASTVTKKLQISSPQAGKPYALADTLWMSRMEQPELQSKEMAQTGHHFLAVDVFAAPPMTPLLSGLEVEYAIALIYSNEAGKREATIGFHVGPQSQDIGFRGETAALFDIRPAIPVKLSIRDADGSPTTCSLTFRDAQNRIHPPQAKRTAPDLFFQPQVYRADGSIVLLPPGPMKVRSWRGPEYLEEEKAFEVPKSGTGNLEIRLNRWINPADYGFVSGDHHIHAAGCAHYTTPTEGVSPADMFQQVKGEGLNVGCVLTWGPCFAFQRQFFSPRPDTVSEARTIVKYDLEISGFGSQALGHVCLLDLKDQTYPGSEGTTNKGWPTWATPVLRWAKLQGAVTGFAHSGSGLEIDPYDAADRLFAGLDADHDVLLSKTEAAAGFLPDSFSKIDGDRNGTLSKAELTAALNLAAERLPNYAIPEMNGVGAMEIGVAAAEGVCDFISAMDTPRIAEWNCWYHLLNCGFPIKVSGETDFPCMSGRRVGQGRVYVQLGVGAPIDFTKWCQGLAAGRSYVNDGFAHALVTTVNGMTPGAGEIYLGGPGTVEVVAKVAFAPQTPKGVVFGTQEPPTGRRDVGDAVFLHVPRSDGYVEGGKRMVEVVVNGRAVDQRIIPADGKLHELRFDIPISQSSWVAVRHFPQLHTNPVNVLVKLQPIRASRRSALWFVETIQQLWKRRERFIRVEERDAAKQTFDRAIERYRQIAAESPEDS